MAITLASLLSSLATKVSLGQWGDTMMKPLSPISVVRLYMDHSLSGIEEGLTEIDADFKAWYNHPTQRGAWQRVVEHLISLRWVLEHHYDKLSGEGLLENSVSMEPGLYSELRCIERLQGLVIDQVDSVICEVETLEMQACEFETLVADYQSLRQEILQVELRQMALLERNAV